MCTTLVIFLRICALINNEAGSYMCRFVAMGLFALILGGCGQAGPSLNPVTGKVTKGGQPLKGISVTFSPVDAGPSSAGLTNDEGKFVLLCQNGKAGAVAGKHKVVLAEAASAGSAPVGYEAMLAARQGGEAKGAKGAPAKSEEKTSFPSEYGNAQTTPLSFEIKAGNNEFDVPIP
jgi:hypothetical protein